MQKETKYIMAVVIGALLGVGSLYIIGMISQPRPTFYLNASLYPLYITSGFSANSIFLPSIQANGTACIDAVVYPHIYPHITPFNYTTQSNVQGYYIYYNFSKNATNEGWLTSYNATLIKSLYPNIQSPALETTLWSANIHDLNPIIIPNGYTLLCPNVENS